VARSKKQLGAASDDPKALISRAIREYNQATSGKRTDEVGVREAAEKGWLAVSSMADVAADRIGMKEPGGAAGRREAIRGLEQEAKLRRGSILGDFEVARTVLHGECFHGGSCPIHVGDLLEGLQDTIKHGMTAIGKLKGRR